MRECHVKQCRARATEVVVIEYGGNLQRLEMCHEHAQMMARLDLAWPNA